MSAQLDAFDIRILAPSVPIDTSEAAAASVSPEPAATWRERCYRIVCAGGATCEEVELATGLRHQSCAARLWELEGLGHIVKSDVQRRNTSGRFARVYVAR